jgi:hypothetical protein
MTTIKQTCQRIDEEMGIIPAPAAALSADFLAALE